MSSRYSAICMSHDPAFVIEGTDWHSPAELQGALADPASTEALDFHRSCDLLGGRYSYPLIEVYCPPRPRHPHHGHWVDAEWLRLVLAANEAVTSAKLTSALKTVSACWSPERIGRLGAELFGVDS